VSNIHEVHPSKVPFELRSGLLFIGGFNHAPNTDGVIWFVSEILPRIHQRLPDVVLRVVGSKMPPEVYELANDHVICEGFVEDVAPLLQNTRVSIAPLRYGSGVKGKVNQAMSFGVPCVATSIAVEGVEAKDGVEILVADTEEAFADSIVRLYTNENLWREVSRESVESLERNFSMEVAESNLRQLLLHHGVLED
jgi:glycosyltransferase involved in cell wall biosynthesis